MRIDLAGKRFGRLVVVRPQGVTAKGELKWRCICDCGRASQVRGANLRSGITKSCGCLKTPHGMTMTPEWRSWREMLARCGNPNNDRYADYGGRGIRVCGAWVRFENFYRDMGKRPPGKTLDRRNNNADYAPENCRWADAFEQQQNTRQARRCIVHSIEYSTIGAAARALGIHRSTMQWRLNHGTAGYCVAAMQQVKEPG